MPIPARDPGAYKEARYRPSNCTNCRVKPVDRTADIEQYRKHNADYGAGYGMH
jgi:hypothetical protein